MRRWLWGFVVAAATVGGSTWAWAGNQEVAEQIAASLKGSGQFAGLRIGVTYQDGTAWLKGQVSSPEQKELAQRLAMQTTGVTRVVNNVTVADSASPQPASAALSAERLPRTTATADRLPTSFAPAAVQPTAALSVQEPTAAPRREQRMPLAIAQSPTPAPAPMPQGAPQAMPQGAPQAMPQGMAQGMPQGAPQPLPQGAAMPGGRYDQPNLPNYAWPGYGASPNYASVAYPRQYSPQAWPYMGPFYPYPQAPLGWRKVTLEWHDGWWFLDFDDGSAHGWFSGLFRHCD